MRRGLFCLLSVALLLGGCGTAERAEMPTTGAVTVENISVENYFETGVNRETFTSVPQRIVIIGANDPAGSRRDGGDRLRHALAEQSDVWDQGVQSGGV